MTVTWRDYIIRNPTKASAESIAKAEKELGVKLRADFLAIAAINQGRAADPSGFDLPDGSNSALGFLFHFEERRGNIVEEGGVVMVLPDTLIPFSRDGFGNLICFDYSETPDHPTVVFWDHERCDDPPLFVASSFTEFLTKLRDRSRV